VLHPLALHRHDLGDRAEEVPHDVDRVRAVVDEHAATAYRGIRVPSIGHLCPRCKDILEQDYVAENS
jgi:hypothetical protein